MYNLLYIRFTIHTHPVFLSPSPPPHPHPHSQTHTQVDSKGQNFLHLAVINEDVEGLIFLLSVRADVNSKVQSPSLNTPLHYAVKSGNEILVRHLVSM